MVDNPAQIAHELYEEHGGEEAEKILNQALDELEGYKAPNHDNQEQLEG